MNYTEMMSTFNAANMSRDDNLTTESGEDVFYSTTHSMPDVSNPIIRLEEHTLVIPEIAYVVLVTIFRAVFVIGLGINILSFNVLWKQSSKTSTEIFFIGLTIADIVFLAANSCLSFLDLAQEAGYLKLTDNPVSYVVSGIMASFLITQALSAIYMTFLSVERLYAVFKPLEFRIIWTPKIGKLAMGGSFCLTTAVMATCSVLAGPHVSVVIFLMTYLLAGITITVANIITIHGLKKSVDFSRSSNILKKSIMERRRKQTKVLLGISAFFMVNVAARIASFAVITASMPDMSDPHNKRNVGNFIAVNLSELIQVLFSILNCILFIVPNGRYRDTFWRLLYCKQPKIKMNRFGNFTKTGNTYFEKV